MTTLPSTKLSDVLTYHQLVFVAKRLPEPHRETGRPAYTNIELLPGILKVLRSGCRWRDLDKTYFNQPSGITHWRRFRFWRNSTAFRLLWNYLLKGLSLKRKLDTRFVSLDGTLVPSFAFRETTGNSGKHHRTGVKVSVLVEHTGMPLSAAIAAGYTHDVQLAERTIEGAHLSIYHLTNATLLADRGYDSLAFRYFLEGKRIKPNIALRAPPKGTKHRYYSKEADPAFNKRLLRQRYVVERTNAWLKSFRRLHFRFDRTRLSFEAFLYLGIIVILVRRLLS